MFPPPHRYAIALGSNRPRAGHSPEAVVRAAFVALATAPLRLLAVSAPHASAPLGPSLRRYANAAAMVETMLTPPALLAHLKAIERRFGRRRGRRWGARTLDLDIILWSGGRWRERALTVPHAAFRTRDFVLRPLAEVAADWRDPVSGLSVGHLLARNRMRKPVDPLTKAL